MIKIYKKLENWWFNINKKIRFLLVGGFNTVTVFLLFICFVETCRLPYQAALIVLYLISVNLSIFSMRYYVFQSTGNLREEYLKAVSFYLAMLLFNYAFLFVTIDLLALGTITAQAIYTVLSVLITYITHQNLTFCAK